MTNKPPRRKRGLLFLLPLVLLWVLPVVAVAVLLPLLNTSNAESISQELPETVTVGERSVALTQSVIVRVQFGVTPQLIAGTGGMVTRRAVLEPGVEIANGADIIWVDAIPVRAFVADAPLYRDLGLDSSGADVEELSRFLISRGALAGEPRAHLDHPMSEAIKGYQREAGIPVDGVFRPSYVLFTPPATTFGQWQVAIGERIAPETTVATGGVTVRAISFDTPPGAPGLRALADRPLVISAGDLTRDIASLTPNAAEALAVSQFLKEATADRLLTETATDESATYDGATLSLRDPVIRGSIPGSALYVDPAGTICVALVEGTDSHAPPVMHPVLDAETSLTEVGQALVGADLIGQTVISDVATLSAEVLSSCE